MKVWLYQDFGHGESLVFTGDSNMLEYPGVKSEVEYYEKEYPEEAEVFADDYNRVVKRGYGIAELEDRFSLELLEPEEV